MMKVLDVSLVKLNIFPLTQKIFLHKTGNCERIETDREKFVAPRLVVTILLATCNFVGRGFLRIIGKVSIIEHIYFT